MSGLLRRIRGARAAAPDPAPDEGAAWSTRGDEARIVDDDATQRGGQPTLPAGVDLDQIVGDRPTSQKRSRLRRRLRHLRRVREVLLRDLGGLVLEVHRSGTPGDQASSQLVGAKLARLDAVTDELHELEHVLADRRGMVLREPGIGGACPTCGELFGSDARFCWACGTPVAPGARRPLLASPPAPARELPALGAAAKEGVPSHEWHAPEPVEPPPPPPPVPQTPSTVVQEEAPAPEDAPTVVQPPHIEGSASEMPR
jgi:hypothetical protein